MKIAAVIIIAFALGGIATHLDFSSLQDSGEMSLAALHGEGQSSQPSEAIALMQTDTALCEQPYFQDLYELSVDYFSKNSAVNADEFAELVFDHARSSGHFSPEEAENWISHIKAIPGQFVDIYTEDPSFLRDCYDFQVAAVGPPR